MPTPKSKPSSTKKPVHKMVMKMNQVVWRAMVASVAQRGDLGGLVEDRLGIVIAVVIARIVESPFGGDVVEVSASGTDHEPAVQRPEHQVEQEEAAEREADLGGRHAGGVGLVGLLEAPDDPRLATGLRQDPSAGVDDERR